MKIIKIPVEGDIELKEIGSELKHLQAEVGGYIETVPSIIENLVIVCDEEGRLKDKKVNVRASMMRYVNRVTAAHCIVGDVFLVIAEGDELVDVSESNLEHVKRLIAARIKQHRDNGWMKG